MNSIEVWVSNALIDLDLIHHELSLICNALKEYDEMKEEIKNSNNK